jgi:hypothetical protein
MATPLGSSRHTKRERRCLGSRYQPATSLPGETFEGLTDEMLAWADTIETVQGFLVAGGS